MFNTDRQRCYGIGQSDQNGTSQRRDSQQRLPRTLPTIPTSFSPMQSQTLGPLPASASTTLSDQVTSASATRAARSAELRSRRTQVSSTLAPQASATVVQGLPQTQAKTYTRVRCLTIRWQITPEDAQSAKAYGGEKLKELAILLKCKEECEDLSALFSGPKFGYETEPVFEIPQANAQESLKRKIKQWIKPSANNPDHLLILYYSGHGDAPRKPQPLGPLKWCKYSSAEVNPEVRWNRVQDEYIVPMVPDCLEILDCCYAAAALYKGPRTGRKEVLAACGPELTTLVRPSFTDHLMTELQQCKLPIRTDQLWEGILHQYAPRRTKPIPVHDVLESGGRSQYLVLNCIGPSGPSTYEVGTRIPVRVEQSWLALTVSETRHDGTGWLYRLSRRGHEQGTWVKEDYVTRLLATARESVATAKQERPAGGFRGSYRGPLSQAEPDDGPAEEDVSSEHDSGEESHGEDSDEAGSASEESDEYEDVQGMPGAWRHQSERRA